MKRYLPTNNKQAAIFTIVLVVLVLGWTQGTFDNFLWRVHLNYTTCGTNGFGATFCGKDMAEYEKRFDETDNCEYDVDTNKYTNTNYPGEPC